MTREALRKRDRLVRKTFIDLSTSIILMSPVDTGRFRANWRASFRRPDLETDLSRDPSGGDAIGRLTAQVRVMPIGASFFFTNNLPYAGRLEFDGHSNQAPAGMVRVSLARFETIFEAAGISARFTQ